MRSHGGAWRPRPCGKGDREASGVVVIRIVVHCGRRKSAHAASGRANVADSAALALAGTAIAIVWA